MSTSTNGLLFYGIPLGEEYEGSYNVLRRICNALNDDDDLDDDDDDDDDLDDDEILEKVYGYVKDPALDALYNEADRDRTDMQSDAWQRWREALRLERARRDTVVPVEVVHYCSGECPMHALAIRVSSHSVARGDLEPLGQSLVADPAWREQIRDACERLGLEFQQPEWLLASYWG